VPRGRLIGSGLASEDREYPADGTDGDRCLHR